MGNLKGKTPIVKRVRTDKSGEQLNHRTSFWQRKNMATTSNIFEEKNLKKIQRYESYCGVSYS